MKYKVSPLTCGQCVRTITNALKRIDSGAKVQVDLVAGTVDAEGTFDSATVVTALAQHGYDAVLADGTMAGTVAGSCCGTCHA